MRWVDSTRIVQWADKRECEGLLPELIRKLIIGSCNTFPKISFPSHDSIYKPGWDGKCHSPEAYNYVPKGQSFWELGRDKDFKRKCNKEYSKRTSETSSAIRKKSTFIFVTPRRWSKAPLKDKWVEAKKKKREWADVRVYDADDLETWIDQQVAIASWFAMELKLLSDDVEAVECYWKRFVDIHKLQASLLISGREKEKGDVVKFFSGPHGVKEIQASSKSEAICLTIACMISESKVSEQDFFSKTVIVSSQDTLKKITRIHEGLNIIFESDNDELLYDSDAGANHIIVPVSYKVRSAGITVPIPKTENFIKSLEGIGYSFEDASRMSQESGRSFSVLKRLISKSPGRVPWGQGNNILELLPIFFVGKIDGGKVGDREIIEQLTGGSFQNYTEKLKVWSLIFDHPVLNVGNYWRIVSPYDLLHVVAKSIMEHHLKKFELAFVKVFETTDPSLDLEPKMRYAAALFNKEKAYSKSIQEGMCQSLVLLAVVGESAGVNANVNLQQWTDRLIRDLLSKKDLNFWLSIENKLHLLAEASPDSFLSELEALIQRDPLIVSSMFNDGEFDLFSPTYHTHILWALEALAWDPKYLSKVSIILADLVRLDKGIKIANKPINTLRHIFLLWLPQTYAQFETRRKVLETLCTRRSDVAFELLKELAPKNHDNGSFNYKPLFRLRDYRYQNITNGEWANSISFVLSKILDLAGDNCDRLGDVINLIDDFHGEDRAKLLEWLRTKNTLAGDVTRLLDILQTFINKHENSSEYYWGLKETELAVVKQFHDRLISNEVDRYYWYFNVDTIEKYGKSGDNYEKLIEKSNEKRKEAIKIILNAQGFDGILELVKRVQRPWLVGYLLAEIYDYDTEVFKLLINPHEKIESFAQGLLNRSFGLKGSTWLDKQVEQLQIENHARRITNFFLALDPSIEIWNLLTKVSEEASSSYWQKASFHHGHFRGKADDLIQCIESLNQVGRFISSVNLITFRKEEVPPSLIISTLEGLVTSPVEPGKEIMLGSHSIEELFIHLEKFEEFQHKMILLEWYYIELLDRSGTRHPPKYLNDEVRKRPEFFVELLTWIYQPENNPPDKDLIGLDKTFVAKRARNADLLLDHLELLPGESSDGEIVKEELTAWISQAIELSRQFDRENKAFYVLGKLLGCARERSDKWPQPAICEIIESLNNENLNEGFSTGMINGSGVKVSIRPAGGSADRSHALYYGQLADRLNDEFPVTARVLNQVSQFYERWATRMDEEDAKDQLKD